jgi:hypothetical protein
MNFLRCPYHDWVRQRNAGERRTLLWPPQKRWDIKMFQVRVRLVTSGVVLAGRLGGHNPGILPVELLVVIYVVKYGLGRSSRGGLWRRLHWLVNKYGLRLRFRNRFRLFPTPLTLEVWGKRVLLLIFAGEAR